MTEEIVGRGIALYPLTKGRRPGPDEDRRVHVCLTQSDQAEVEQSIEIILRTPLGRRVMRPTFGSRLHELLFAPNNLATAVNAKRYIKEALGMWEPRITVLDVQAQPDKNNRNELQISIRYEINKTYDQRTLVFPFYLIPEE